MNKNKAWYLSLILLLATISYIFALVTNLDFLQEVSRSVAVPLLLILLLLKKKKGYLFFGLFLLAFSISEIVYYFEGIYRDFTYYTVMVSYIIAYLCLFNHLVFEMSFKILFKKFIFHILVLLGLAIYLFISLDAMINFHKIKIPILGYVLESSYNFFVILVLVFSILHYLYHMTTKALILFIACLFLCFSELAQMAYLFLKAEKIINIVYSVFFIIGFYFMYRYIIFEEIKNVHSDIE